MSNTKDTSIIPQGHYCYTWLETPSESNNFKGKVKPCPYFTKKEFNGVEVPWCNFLDCGGLDNSHEDEDIGKLVEYFGDADKMHSALPLSLLWDSVKECGVNMDDPEENL
jgi:hypothetical protein